MGLEDIYKQRVNKTPINQTGLSTGIPSTRERDPNQVKLEQDVFSKMQEVSRPPETKQEESKPVQQVASVGLEQALKELINGVESLDDKS